MNTDIKNLAAVLATVVWADGVYDEAEKVAVEEIAEALELDNAELTAAVEAALGEVENMNEEQVNEYILNNSGYRRRSCSIAHHRFGKGGGRAGTRLLKKRTPTQGV